MLEIVLEILCGVFTQDGIITILFVCILVWLGTRFEKLIKNLIKVMTANNLLILGVQRELLAHDLTSMGINVSEGESQDARTIKALKKYEELRVVLLSIEKAIIQLSSDD